MLTYSGSSINKIFYQILADVTSWPKEVRRDGKVTWDSPCPVVIELTNPRHRVLSVIGRLNSLPASAAETLWVLKGRDDIEWLSYYLPRAKDFSDDGETWRAGYGPRLRGPEEDLTWRTDQLFCVVEELRREPNSRRAVISMFEPGNDYSWLHSSGTKDFPCTGYLSFMPRGDSLDLLVTIRSNDLIWGFSSVNIFEWTVLHELVAMFVGKRLGTYTQVSNSLHVYEDMNNRMSTMIEAAAAYEELDIYDSYPASTSMWSIEMYLDKWLDVFFETESAVRKGDVEWDEVRVRIWKMPLVLRDLATVVLIAAGIQGKIDVSEELACIADPAMRLGTFEWLNRVHKMHMRLPAPFDYPESLRLWVEKRAINET